MTSCRKSDIENVIKTLHEETSVEEAMEKLYLLSKIEKGIQQVDRGKVISHKEVEKRLKNGQIKMDHSGSRRYRSNMRIHC